MRGFVELRWRSNGGWMEAIGCATEAAICTCEPAQNRCGRPQVLPAYGLQDLHNKHQDPKTKSNPNTMPLQTTLGEDHGSGHLYLAKTRTFLLCIDTNLAGSSGREREPSFPFRFLFETLFASRLIGWPMNSLPHLHSFRVNLSPSRAWWQSRIKKQSYSWPRTRRHHSH